MLHRRLAAIVGLGVALGVAPSAAQTPQPFPRPSSSRGVLPPGTSTPPKTPATGQVAPPGGVRPPAATSPQAPVTSGQPAATVPQAPGASGQPPATVTPTTTAIPAGAPDEGALGVPLYPGAQFLASFDAGKGQRYVLYGTPATFAQVVAFYRGSLKSKGDLVFEQPPTHAFDVGRFREDAMAFPPGVTVKDYTFGGSQGYLHVGPSASAQRFPTVLQIVPPPPAAVRR